MSLVFLKSAKIWNQSSEKKGRFSRAGNPNLACIQEAALSGK